MKLLHTLRNTPWLAKMALLWFALTLGVAVASPVLHPQTQITLCSAGGTMLNVLLNDDGSLDSSSATLDCPLCVLGHAGAPAQARAHEPIQPLGRVLQSIPAAHIAAASAAPPPSRGPPNTI
jgi:hypothetical protein